jgi:tetratricopeptide (TPR) repeat protein
LFAQWGGQTGGKQRGYLQDHELTRLGLLARDPRVLAATGADALRFLDRQFEYLQAAAWAKEMLAIVDAAGVPASVDLLRTAAERCQQVGDVAEANVFRGRALKLIRQGGETDTMQYAATLITHARALVHQGQPDEALGYLERAKELPLPGREQAIVLGDIARIRAAQGEVDAALPLYQEVLRICEELGDKKGRAVTLGDIAWIKRQKGEVDAVHQLLQEKLAIVEALRDKRSQAVTLGDIARIKRQKGEVDAALQLHLDELRITRELGDVDGTANTLWSIAQTEIYHQKWQEAYDHLAESYAINLKLGHLDGICFVGLDLGQLLCAAGQRQEGIAILIRSRDGFVKLGRPEEAQQVQALLDKFTQ